MKNLQSLTVTDAAMWLSVGAAVCFAVVLTNSAAPLWFFLIPFLCSIYHRSDHLSKKDGAGIFDERSQTE